MMLRTLPYVWAVARGGLRVTDGVRPAGSIAAARG
ncbi:hypothetical protein FHS32_005408 [Streptomyces albaduncus]|uniref:Uncharacterized protein n=1 Tax=Streptomyces griseoloalbus TaxID=67303 RepID=A0A7W8BS90_9ACTN|nr:hypothetical protein [Streptomyces albaduncus]